MFQPNLRFFRRSYKFCCDVNSFFLYLCPWDCESFEWIANEHNNILTSYTFPIICEVSTFCKFCDSWFINYKLFTSQQMLFYVVKLITTYVSLISKNNTKCEIISRQMTVERKGLLRGVKNQIQKHQINFINETC